MNDRTQGIKGTMGMHGEAITASSIMAIARTWCNQFGKEHLKATLNDVQYNPKSKELTHKIVSELGWSLKKGPVMPCKSYSARKEYFQI